MEKEYLTIEEVAQKMRVNKHTVYRMARKGQIPALRFGRSWRINTIELEKLFKGNLKK